MNTTTVIVFIMIYIVLFIIIFSVFIIIELLLYPIENEIYYHKKIKEINKEEINKKID
jgi:hypothetical protein